MTPLFTNCRRASGFQRLNPRKYILIFQNGGFFSMVDFLLKYQRIAHNQLILCSNLKNSFRAERSSKADASKIYFLRVPVL